MDTEGATESVCINRVSVLSRSRTFFPWGQCTTAVYYTGALKAGLDCTGFLLYVICPVTKFVVNNDLAFSLAL